MRRQGRRSTLLGYLYAYVLRRRTYVWVGIGLAGVVGGLLIYSSTLQDYGRNLGLNLSADLIGTIIVLFTVSPLLERGERRGDSVRENFDHNEFIRNAADARRRIAIMELWTDLLQGGYQKPFLDSLRTALRQNARVRILLLNPDARAAEQRADDLLQQTNVVGDILENLRILHTFISTEVPERHRGNIEVRVYSALPPVQLYRTDEQLVVSFYPTNITSWNATQYVTSPDSQLGTFVSAKFDELWEARSTRSIEQFREITVQVVSDTAGKTYQTRFIPLGHATYVNGHDIIADYATNGIGGLAVQTFDDNVQGIPDVRGPFLLEAADVVAADYATVQELFHRKYGSNHDLVFKLVQSDPEPLT